MERSSSKFFTIGAALLEKWNTDKRDKQLKLYKIDFEYYVGFDNFVVIASTEQEALSIVDDKIRDYAQDIIIRELGLLDVKLPRSILLHEYD